jgi:4-oxalocrotonate tautomerase
MPFLSIRMLEGHSKQRKHEIARRVVDAVSEVAELPREAIRVDVREVCIRRRGPAQHVRHRFDVTVPAAREGQGLEGVLKETVLRGS